MLARVEKLVKSAGLYPVMQLLAALPRRSKLYPMVRRWRDTRALRSWSTADAARLAFYTQLIEPGDLVFDIGANVGNRAKVFLRLGARVVAFEPQSACADMLQRELSGQSAFRLVRKALGDKSGSAELHIGAAHVLSTMSEPWMDATLKSGRFGAEQWRDSEQVTVTTFDEVIREFGSPAFAKIDVEGFEPQVLSGLSQPLRSGSLELAAEARDGIFWCMERLASLHPCEFQFSPKESMRFDWPQWLTLQAACRRLDELIRDDRYAWGDIYFRLPLTQSPAS